MLKPEVKLYDHQARAVGKIKDHNGNLILSHGTGSGKTLTAIAAFEKMKEEGAAKKALVVTPASLRVNFQENGVEKFTDSKAAIFGNSQEAMKGIARTADDPDPKADYHVVSYEMFRKDPKKYIDAAGADTVIYDELHKIRNEAGITYKTLRDARKHHKNFIGLTGSVMNNTPGDLVPLVDAMTDGNHRLGSKASFEGRFVKEDKKGKHITNDRLVRALLNPYIDHFETKDLSDQTMPKKVVQEVKVMMSPYQEELYRYAVDKMDPVTKAKFRYGFSKLKARDINNIFSKLTQARQVSNSIHTIDLETTPEESAEKTPKVKRLLEDVADHLIETPDSQVVVHSNLIHGGVDVLQAGLKKKGIPFATFIGKGNPGVTEESRQKAVEDFNAGKKKVIVISAAGGEGLDLRNATMFASLDGHFNPERIQQAEARAVRAGGQAHRDPEDRRVIVKRYVNVIPRTLVGTAMELRDLVNPVEAVKRHLAGAPVVFNPFKREQSTDEWMYELANKKNTLNEEFRQQMKKAASAFVIVEDHLDSMEKEASAEIRRGAFLDEIEKIAKSSVQDIPYQQYKHVKSDTAILKHYWDELGGRIEKMDNPIEDELKEDSDIKSEQEHIEALRKYYREVAKGMSNRKDGEPGYMFHDKKIKTDKEHWNSIMKGTAIAGGVTGVMLSPAVMEPIINKTFKVLRGAPEPVKAVAAVAAALGIPALAGTAMLAPVGVYTGMRGVHVNTSASAAKKLSKMEDNDLRTMLRGAPVVQEVVKRTSHYIASE
jgi:superfamily II DNA or RNA helicase